jgi:hypothetical protein
MCALKSITLRSVKTTGTVHQIDSSQKACTEVKFLDIDSLMIKFTQGYDLGQVNDSNQAE